MWPAVLVVVVVAERAKVTLAAAEAIDKGEAWDREQLGPTAFD
jgi:hypothetical protein